ncbi:MAG: YigZ family protein [Clostridiales bacterium]|nr:YigZ family protein [Clostridiales bacterium]
MINKSRFLGYCLPVASEAQAQEALSAIRKRHYDARHCCYAFRLAQGGIARSSDDGEPSGTAGAPILSVLNGAEVENALIAVVRYFGGVLLGTGGLVRAYGRAASEALEHAAIARMQLCRSIRVAVSYPSYHALEPLLRTSGYPCEADYGERVTLTLLLPEEEADAFIAAITQRTDGSAAIEPLGLSLEAVPLNP